MKKYLTALVLFIILTLGVTGYLAFYRYSTYTTLLTKNSYFVLHSKKYIPESEKLEISRQLFLEKFERNEATKLLLTIKNSQDDKTKLEANFLLGRIYFVTNQPEKAVEAYTECLSLDPKYEQAYYGRALVYGFMGERYYNEAIRDFHYYIDVAEEKQAAGQKISGLWAGYNDLAWVYFLNGNLQGCIKNTRTAISTIGSNPWLHNMLGVCLMNNNMKEEALKNLSMALVQAQNLSDEEFGEAYSADNHSTHTHGRQEMIETIKENIEKASE